MNEIQGDAPRGAGERRLLGGTYADRAELLVGYRRRIPSSGRSPTARAAQELAMQYSLGRDCRINDLDEVATALGALPRQPDRCRGERSRYRAGAGGSHLHGVLDWPP